MTLYPFIVAGFLIMSITTSPFGGFSLTIAKPPTTVASSTVTETVQATPAAPAVAEGVKVDLSSKGKAAASSASRDSDIEQSGLPASVQKLLKAIRELQRQIAELTEQIQQVMKDPSLSDDERKSRAAGLQVVMSILQAQISSTSADMSTLMNRLDSSNDDKFKAGMLVLSNL